MPGVGMLEHLLAETAHIDLRKKNDIRLFRIVDKMVDLDPVHEGVFVQGIVPGPGSVVTFRISRKEKNTRHFLP